MFETTWQVNGKSIYITSDWLGDEPWAAMPENYNRNEITVSVDNGAEETFYAWGSIMNPQFDDEYSLKNIFSTICDEALTIIWNQEDEAVDGLSYSEAKRIIDGMTENAEKLQRAGLTEDDLEAIVNDEEWH